MTSLLNKHVFGEEGDTINSYFKDWKQDRGQAYQNVCVLVYFIEKYPLPITSVSSIALGSWLKRVDAPEVHLRRKVDTVFYYYIELMKMYQDVAITACGKKLSPIGKPPCILLGSSPSIAHVLPAHRILFHRGGALCPRSLYEPRRDRSQDRTHEDLREADRL